MVAVTLHDHTQAAAEEQLQAEISIPAAVAECESIADKISDNIKRLMPCDCREQGSRVRCGNCGQ